MNPTNLTAADVPLASVPVIPAQPSLANYAVSALALFQTYTRDSYLATFGLQAPAWNPSWPAKYWFDSTVDRTSAASVSYTVFDSGSASLQPLSLSAAEAATVNLPGAVSYPAYVIAPTVATRGGPAVDPRTLSLQADAAALMAQLGGSNLVDGGLTDTPLDPVVYPADELRRMWEFTLGGVPLNAGLLLAAQNAKGIGAPGQWVLNAPGNPVWVPTVEPTGVDDTRPAVAMPLRNLLADEELVPSPLGLGGATIVRTDLGAAQGDGYTAADRALLQQIYNLLVKLGS
jgi:hypothetical protein